MNNDELARKIDKLSEAFGEFVDDYERTMHGDTKINGDQGMVGHVRELRDYMKKYPSVRWYMAHEPRRFWATVAALFAGASAIFIKESRDWWIGVLRGWLGL